MAHACERSERRCTLPIGTGSSFLDLPRPASYRGPALLLPSVAAAARRKCRAHAARCPRLRPSSCEQRRPRRAAAAHDEDGAAAALSLDDTCAASCVLPIEAPSSRRASGHCAAPIASCGSRVTARAAHGDRRVDCRPLRVRWISMCTLLCACVLYTSSGCAAALWSSPTMPGQSSSRSWLALATAA